MRNFAFWPTMGLIILMLAIFIFPSNVYASEETKQLYGQLDKDIKMVNEMNSYVEKTKDDSRVIVAKLGGYKDHFQESIKIYNSLSSSTDPTISSVARNSKDDASYMSEGIGLVAEGLSVSDSEKYNKGISQINSTIDSYNKTINEIKQTTYDYGSVYVICSVLFGLVSLILLIKAKIKTKFPSEQIKKKCEMELFRSSLWPTVGSIITSVWYYLTPPGGTYYLLWGPMLIGFIYFVRQVWIYFNEVRPSLKKSINKEKEEYLKFQRAEEQHEKANHCFNCGKKIETEDRYCVHCGARIEEA